MLDSRRVGAGALLLLPAGLMGYLAFNSGGFYPGATAYAALLLCVVGIVRVLAADEPLIGLGWWLVVAASALALLALLALLSSSWSHIPGVALAEFDLPLNYLLALLICGSGRHHRSRLVWVCRTLAFGILIVCACGLITRLLPHLWPTTPELSNQRLSFPVTYWNVLGLLTVFGIVLCVHFSSERSEPAALRVLAAAAVPILATTLYFTFSRGAIATSLVVLLLYALSGRPRLLISTVLATGPTTAVALKVAYDANLLATPDPTTHLAVAQGRHVAVVLLICVLVSAGLRAVLLLLDSRLERFSLPAPTRQKATRGAWIGLAALALIVVVALSGTISHDFHQFLHSNTGANHSDLRARLTDPGNNGRVNMWKVAWKDFKAHPLLGHGAGTFANTYAQKRPDTDFVHDAHSLYVETLDELGVVGLALLLVAMIAILARTASRARGRDRPLYAAVLAVLVAYALHAAIDWDWEMPVVTVVFFSLGGFVLARDPAARAEAVADPRERRTAPLRRVQLAIVLGLLGVAPAYMWLSQGPLNRAVDAFAIGNCRVATREAVSSISTLGVRAEPYQILSFCDIRQGEPLLAMQQIKRAIALDPNNWKYTYSLALMRATAGLDPRPTLRQALALDPREFLIQDAWRLLNQASPVTWQVVGRELTNQFTSL